MTTPTLNSTSLATLLMKGRATNRLLDSRTTVSLETLETMERTFREVLNRNEICIPEDVSLMLPIDLGGTYFPTSRKDAAAKIASYFPAAVRPRVHLAAVTVGVVAWRSLNPED